jgi:hypothetical protein
LLGLRSNPHDERSCINGKLGARPVAVGGSRRFQEKQSHANRRLPPATVENDLADAEPTFPRREFLAASASPSRHFPGNTRR